MFGLENVPSGCQIDVLKPGGWAGDQLIWAGARNVLRQHGVAFRQFPSDREALACYRPSKQLYVYGSGGYCEGNHSLLTRLPPILARYESVTIMPSSFDTNYEPVARFLAELNAGVTVYARERYSFEQARDCCRYPERIHLDHDTAFQFNFLPWIKPLGQGQGMLDDVGGRIAICEKVQSVKDLMQYVNGFATVQTDRAHVAITAAMLRKPTRVYPGTYHKLRGIYEFSLAHMAHVEFVT